MTSFIPAVIDELNRCSFLLTIHAQNETHHYPLLIFGANRPQYSNILEQQATHRVMYNQWSEN